MGSLAVYPKQAPGRWKAYRPQPSLGKATMKRSIIAAAAAVAAIALLTGCSATTEAPKVKPSPSSTPTQTAQPSDSPVTTEPPAGADAQLVAFVDTLDASCTKARTEGSVAKSADVLMISVPAAKAIEKATDVFISIRPDGKNANFVQPTEVRSGEPAPFVCSVYGAAFGDLMKDGKSAKFSAQGSTWTWDDKDMNMSVVFTAKDKLISNFKQSVKGQDNTLTMDFAYTYGITDADYKMFKDAVANPTTPPTPKG